MKISNETKVGALTAIAITVLILGFNFLKGKSATGKEVYAVFPNVDKLVVSSPVAINGLPVGKVTNLQDKDVNIPRNSVATMTSELLGTTGVSIFLGNGTDYVKEGDTIRVERSLQLT